MAISGANCVYLKISIPAWMDTRRIGFWNWGITVIHLLIGPSKLAQIHSLNILLAINRLGKFKILHDYLFILK